MTPADRRSTTPVPDQVIVFSGHLIDEPGRQPARFPDDPALVERARAAIAAALDALGAGAGTLALTQGACGGDLLFSAACLDRGVDLRWLQPFDEADFVERSVARGGPVWRRRYDSQRARLTRPPRALPVVLGAPLPDDPHTPYWRCNRWLVDTARSYGAEKLHFVGLWDGAAADSDGGTAQMLDDIRPYARDITLIDLAALAAPRGPADPG